MNPYYAFLIAFCSWLLGLLTPGIVDAIQKPKERRELASGLRVELGELRQRLAIHAWAVWNHHGLLTHENQHWAIATVESGPQGGHLKPEAMNAMKGIAKFPVEELEKMNARNKAQRKGLGLSVPRVDAPFFTAHLGRLNLFPAETQRQLLYINQQLGLFNEQIEKTAQCFQMTFSANSQDNIRIVRESLQVNEESVAMRARVAAEAIADLKIGERSHG